jgi:hypothetical protein
MKSHNLFSKESKADNKILKNFESFIEWMNKDVGSFEKISEEDIALFFAEEFEYCTNDKITATTPHELSENIKVAKTKYQKAYISSDITILTIEDNTVKANYKVTFIDINGMTRDDTNSINVTFNQDGKVDKFHQSYSIQPPMNKLGH